VAFALQADGWWLRSDVVWSKPNPMPESVTDRPTRAHEYVFLLAKSARYFYDADAIREPPTFRPPESRQCTQRRDDSLIKLGRSRGGNGVYGEPSTDPAGRNKRTVWTIPTQPFKDAHFATFPEALVKVCMQAGTSEWGCCAECGASWTRAKGAPEPVEGRGSGNKKRRIAHAAAVNGRLNTHMGSSVPWMPTESRTVGWHPTCAHESVPVPCVVLDPFSGSGTVGVVAQKGGRRAILIDASADYCAMARDRLRQGALV